MKVSNKIKDDGHHAIKYGACHKFLLEHLGEWVEFEPEDYAPSLPSTFVAAVRKRGTNHGYRVDTRNRPGLVAIRYTTPDESSAVAFKNGESA
jgi:hypothetical protein